jgi:hypothetical protein
LLADLALDLTGVLGFASLVTMEKFLQSMLMERGACMAQHTRVNVQVASTSL